MLLGLQICEDLSDLEVLRGLQLVIKFNNRSFGIVPGPGTQRLRERKGGRRGGVKSLAEI